MASCDCQESRSKRARQEDETRSTSSAGSASSDVSDSSSDCSSVSQTLSELETAAENPRISVKGMQKFYAVTKDDMLSKLFTSAEAAREAVESTDESPSNFNRPARLHARNQELEDCTVTEFQAPVSRIAIIRFADNKPDLVMSSMEVALKWAEIHGHEGFFRIEQVTPMTEDDLYDAAD